MSPGNQDSVTYYEYIRNDQAWIQDSVVQDQDQDQRQGQIKHDTTIARHQYTVM